MNLLIRIIVNAIAVFVLANLLNGIYVEDTGATIVVAVVLILLNTFLKPLLVILTLPINLITLGLFTLVINALIVMLADRLIDGFAVEDFWWALLFGLILSIVNGIIDKSDD